MYIRTYSYVMYVYLTVYKGENFLFFCVYSLAFVIMEKRTPNIYFGNKVFEIYTVSLTNSCTICSPLVNQNKTVNVKE